MELINAINFAPFPRRGVLGHDNAKASLEALAARTKASHIILSPAGLQESAHAETIDFLGEGTPTDEEISGIINYAQRLGLHVILKPTVNCKDGTWRAFINFFDKDVPGEPQWRNWFASHEAFQLHYAAIAEQTGCVMFILGCEMVMAERREAEWRDLAAKAKQVFKGPISYNTDKYQEDTVRWWDCVDVISSSGYYPSGAWETELDRIEAVVHAYKKPFFFAEAGCMSVKGASQVPNNWKLLDGAAHVEEQSAWYNEMFEHTKRRSWVGGYGLWSWSGVLPYTEDCSGTNKSYELYAKPAETVVLNYFQKPCFV
jgi:hypothetical protein